MIDRQRIKQFPFLYEDTLKHLIWMAKMPAAKHHAWYRAKELDQDASGLWVGIKDDLVKHMKDQKND